MFEIKNSETIQLSEGLKVGVRTLFVASRVLTFATQNSPAMFAGLVSPFALIIEDQEQYRIFSIDHETEKEQIILDNFIRSLSEK